MNGKINIDNLVRQELPIHKRQPVRLHILRGLVTPLRSLYDDFVVWRDRIRLELNLNSQTAILEGYLRHKYGASIRVSTFADGLVWVALINESENFIPQVSLDDSTPLEVALERENQQAIDDYDFIVYVPAGVDLNDIIADIERYKKATVTYTIIQS